MEMVTEIQTTNQETSLPFLSLLPDRHAHFTQASERQHHYKVLNFTTVTLPLESCWF